MGAHAENTRRIAKNTLLLYARMLFSMLVSLYTSRVVLNTLGVEDYGIYNVVGGVIGLLSFLTSSLGGASSRFLTFCIGKGDMEALRRTFSNILSIYVLLASVILILGETVGLWFMSTRLQIPAERQYAALWVYQFSVFSTVLGILCAPYVSTIVAHERMTAFAYISIVDVVLKLVIVYCLTVIPYDKLIVYALLLLATQLFDCVAYLIYSTHHFAETRTRTGYDRGIFKEILGYSGWVLNGNLAVMGYTQGLNVLLNIFFGPIVNTARGIAVQVQSVCMNFCANFQTALNPQLTKSYARDDLSYMHSLLIGGSKFSFFVLFIVILPLMFETVTVLKLWLGVIPEHTVTFIRIMLCISLIKTLSNPILISVHATGRIRRFQLIEGSMLLGIVPVSYILLKFFHTPPASVFLVHLVIETCTQYVRLRIVLPMIGMEPKRYYKEVIAPIARVAILAPIIPGLLYCVMDTNILRLLAVCVTGLSSCLIFIYKAGCTQEERAFATAKLTQYTRYTKERIKSVMGNSGRNI